MFWTNHIKQSSYQLMMLYYRNPMLNYNIEQLAIDHAHMLAKEDSILYVHMCNIKIIFLFESLEFWVG